MTRLACVLTFSAVLMTAHSAFAAAPQVMSLSATSVPQSGRVRIFGEGFGPPPASSPDARVEIGGVAVATARWSDSAISAYITDAVPVGPTTLRVVTSEGASAALPLTVEPLPAATDKVAWKFQVDGVAIRHRVGVGPDGTVVASDVLGFVYAIGEDGLLRWIHDAPRRAGHQYADGAEGPVAVGADGTVYVGIDPLGPELQLHALNPDGSVKWILTEASAQTVSGPAVGPDGDIYWATTASGHGMQRISPEGARVWSHPGDPVLDAAYYERSEELVFGPSKEGDPVDQVYFALTRSDLWNGNGTPPFLYGFDLAGQQRFSIFVQSLSQSFSARGQVSVAPNGTVHLASWGLHDGWGLHAHAPDTGARSWSWHPDPGNHVSVVEFDPAGNMFVMHDGPFLTSLDADGGLRWETTMAPGSRLGPSLSPDGALILIDGFDIAPDGELDAYSAETGALLWTLEFPVENGTFQAPSARARFTADGARAYVSTQFGGQPEGEEYGYLYALDVGGDPAPDPDGETDGAGSSTGGDGSTGDTTDGGASTAPTGGGEGTGTDGGGEGTGTDDGDGSSGQASGGAQDPGAVDGCACTANPSAGLPGTLASLFGFAVAFVARRRRA